MTISTTTTTNRYTGNAATTVFPYTFRILAATDLVVTKRLATTLVESTLVYPADYSVSGVGNATGGSVTLTSAPATGDLLVIERDTSRVQGTSIRNQGSYFPETHENVFDKLTMLVQEDETALERTFSLPKTLDPATYNMELPVPQTGQVLVWGVNDLTNGTVSSGNVVLPGEGRTTDTLTTYLANNYVYNALDYDAAGNNSPGSATANVNGIQTALNNAALALPIGGGGADVFLPKGVYYINQQIKIPGYVRLTGAGDRSTVIIATGDFPINTPLVRLGLGDGNLAFHCGLRSLMVDCNNVAGSIGIYSTEAQEASGCDEYVVQNFRDVGVKFDGGGATTVSAAHLRRGEILQAQANGFGGANGGILLISGGNIQIDDHTVSGGIFASAMAYGIKAQGALFQFQRVRGEGLTELITVDAGATGIIDTPVGKSTMTQVIRLTSTFAGGIVVLNGFIAGGGVFAGNYVQDQHSGDGRYTVAGSVCRFYYVSQGGTATQHAIVTSEDTDWRLRQANVHSTGDLDFVGGYKNLLVGWSQVTTVAASQTAVALTDGQTPVGRPLAFAGSIRSVSAVLSSNRTAGTLTAFLQKSSDGGSTWSTIVGPSAIVNTATNRSFATFTKDLYTFAAGDLLRAVVTTDGSWTPTANNLYIACTVEF